MRTKRNVGKLFTFLVKIEFPGPTSDLNLDCGVSKGWRPDGKEQGTLTPPPDPNIESLKTNIEEPGCLLPSTSLHS